MIKYTNFGLGLGQVTYTDGSANFLKRGESVTSDKPVKFIDKGIRTETVAVESKTKQQKDNKIADSDTSVNAK